MTGVKSPSRHYCDYAECGKSFRRAEHLTRHKLNHTNSTIQCPQCDRVFYRRDLLHRHLTLKHGKSSNNQSGASGSEQPQMMLAATTSRDQSSVQLDVGVGAGHAALPLLDQLYPFPSPPLDLGESWAAEWTDPTPSIIPTNLIHATIENLGHSEDLSGFVETQCLNSDWVNQPMAQDVYISQEMTEALMNLEPVVESYGRLSIQEVRSVINAACSFIAQSLPILHMPTFSFDLVKQELCISIFCVGLLISPEAAFHGAGCALLASIRSTLLQHVNQKAIQLADLDIIQAMLLVEFSGMYLANRAAMELSDIFHGVLVTICRRLGLFEISNKLPHMMVGTVDDTEGQNTVELECAKRLAYFVFALDVEQALFFGHERSIHSPYAMKLELPMDDGAWSAGTFSDQEPSRTKFHSLCHEILSGNEDRVEIPPQLSPTSNLVLLLGLSSVALDLLRRQHDPFLDAKAALTRLGTALPAVYNRLLNGPGGHMCTHGRVVYHVTVIALCTPLDDLERAANDGFSRTGHTPRHRARAAIIRLLTKRVGPEPARHAIHLLRLFLLPATEIAASTYARPSLPTDQTWESPYEPSALYFAVLALWAYMISRVSDVADDGSQSDSLSDRDSHHLQTPGSSPSDPATVAAQLQSLEMAVEKDDIMTFRRQWRSMLQHVTARLSDRHNNNAREYSQVLGSLSDNLGF